VSDARSAILGRIAAALADVPEPVAIPRDYRRATPPETDLVERFAERVADYRATVHRATGATLAATIAQVLTERGIGMLVVPAGTPDGWLGASDVTRLGDDPPLSHRDLDAADGVITGCAVAIAETGTIVLDAGAGQGRRALSLLPDRHLCIVEADRIVGDERHRARAGRGRPRATRPRRGDRRGVTGPISAPIGRNAQAQGRRPQPSPRVSKARPQRRPRTATRTPNAASTRIAAAAMDASRCPAWNSP
jgi:L-lactate dehydrogenase complex protein LldG